MVEKSALQLALEEICESGEQDFTIRSYSGRAMYGKSCLAITGENINLFELGFAVAKTEVYGEEVEWQVTPNKTDNMGTGYVVYWPKVPYVKEVDEQEEEK